MLVWYFFCVCYLLIIAFRFVYITIHCILVCTWLLLAFIACVTNNSAYSSKRRHIHIRHCYLTEIGIIWLEYVKTERNHTDPLTKGLSLRRRGPWMEESMVETLSVVKQSHEYLYALHFSSLWSVVVLNVRISY